MNLKYGRIKSQMKLQHSLSKDEAVTGAEKTSGTGLGGK
jgi:hypothetical protein